MSGSGSGSRSRSVNNPSRREITDHAYKTFFKMITNLALEELAVKRKKFTNLALYFFTLVLHFLSI